MFTLQVWKFTSSCKVILINRNANFKATRAVLHWVGFYWPNTAITLDCVKSISLLLTATLVNMNKTVMIKMDATPTMLSINKFLKQFNNQSLGMTLYSWLWSHLARESKSDSLTFTACINYYNWCSLAFQRTSHLTFLLLLLIQIKHMLYRS